jgi:dienelactone hydrolase
MDDRLPFRRWEPWVLVFAGWIWLEYGRGSGWISLGLAAVPGLLLLASGVSSLLWPGDPRERHFGALGAFAGLLVGPLSVLWLGPAGALLVVALSAASALAMGHLAVQLQDRWDDVPKPPGGVRMALEVAVDEAVLAQMALSAPTHALRGDGERVAAEVKQALALFRERGWSERPETYHRTPPPLEKSEVRRRRTRGTHFEQLSFESEYEPHEEEPGRERWLSYTPCRTAHAWVLRHPESTQGPRPWLVCIHGYQMGVPLLDFGAFRPDWLHQRLRLNLLLPVLPIHGPRRIRRISGDGFLAGDLLDTVHALAQTAWDLRRLVSWIRAQGGTQIGVYGLSLGGYSTALLASFDEGLRCAIAGIPATDFARLSWKHGPADSLRRAEELGLGLNETMDLKRVVSPLALAPKVPRAGRYLFGGTVDQLVPADLVRDLWRHWEHPRIAWYPGAHCTFGMHGQVRRFIEDALRESDLVS